MTEEIKTDKANNQKKKKPKGKERDRHGSFNILDALIILCVIAIVALLFLVYSPFDLIDTSKEETTLIYAVRICGVPSEYAGVINIGDAVSDSNGYELGKVASAVEVEAHTLYVFDNVSGGVKSIIHPDLVDLIITVSAQADVYEDGFRVNGCRIAVESDYDLLLPNFEGSGMCVSLSEEYANDAGGAK